MKRNAPKDEIKALKKSAREEYGFEPEKVEKSKKAYNRKKMKKKVNPDDPDFDDEVLI